MPRHGAGISAWWLLSRHHRRITTAAWESLRRQTLDRDGWRCQGCGKAGALEVHHVKPLAEGGVNALGNLTTLCRDCHLKTHRALKPIDAWDIAVQELEAIC